MLLEYKQDYGKFSKLNMLNQKGGAFAKIEMKSLNKIQN